MSDPTKPTETTDKAKPAMTVAQAAKAVKRPVLVPAKKPGDEPKVELVPVSPAEVLSVRDYGTHVVVVTKDGQKFSSADAKAEAEAA